MTIEEFKERLLEEFDANGNIPMPIAEELVEKVYTEHLLKGQYDTFEPIIDKQPKVNHPSHYNGTKHECIKIMELLFGKKRVKIWCDLNIFKYRWRSYLKNGEEDIGKSVWYEDYSLKLKKKMKKKKK